MFETLQKVELINIIFRVKAGFVGESVSDIVENNMTFLRSSLEELNYMNERIGHNLK